MKFRLSLVIGVAITFLLTVMLVYSIMTPGLDWTALHFGQK
jgi:hypothetical protein